MTAYPRLAQVGVDRAKLPAVGDVRQAGVDVFEVLPACMSRPPRP